MDSVEFQPTVQELVTTSKAAVHTFTFAVNIHNIIVTNIDDTKDVKLSVWIDAAGGTLTDDKNYILADYPLVMTDRRRAISGVITAASGSTITAQVTDGTANCTIMIQYTKVV